jgi:putative transposase
MFKGEGNKKLCEEVLHIVAKRHKIEITELSVMSDHIHIVVGIPPTMSVSKALQLLKGTSARELFKRRTYFRCRYPKGNFWSPGKFYRSFGDADTETVLQYVRNQRLQQTSLKDFPNQGYHPREAPLFITGSSHDNNQVPIKASCKSSFCLLVRFFGV